MKIKDFTSSRFYFVKMLLRHTCEGRYPVPVGFSKPPDYKVHALHFTLRAMQGMFEFDPIKFILPSQE